MGQIGLPELIVAAIVGVMGLGVLAALVIGIVFVVRLLRRRNTER